MSQKSHIKGEILEFRALSSATSEHRPWIRLIGLRAVVLVCLCFEVPAIVGKLLIRSQWFTRRISS